MTKEREREQNNVSDCVNTSMIRRKTKEERSRTACDVFEMKLNWFSKK